MVESKRHNEIYLVADAALSYGTLMKVVSGLKAADPEITILLATEQQTRLLQGEHPSPARIPATMVCFHPPVLSLQRISGSLTDHMLTP